MSWKVNNQAGLTTLIPLAIAVLALSVFYIDKQNHGLDDSLNTLGETMASQVAAAAAHGISTNQQLSTIKSVIGSALTVPDVISVTIVNTEGSIVLRSLAESRDPQFNSAKTNISTSLIFMRPIRMNKIAATTPTTHKLTDAEINSDVEHIPNIGWTIVELSPNITEARQLEMMKSGMLIGLLIFSIAALLILRMMNKITKPISILSATANEIKQGNFEIDLVTGAKGELATLESSIKDMAKALKQSRDKLESRINQATMDLLRSIHVVERQNSELKSAREQALLASRVKTEFLANMSHEIRTPMNGVLGFLKLLRKTNPSNEQLTHIDTIEKSANNLLSIINDILDISKIEAGKVELQSVRYAIRDCIETVISLLSTSAYDKQIELVYFIYNDVPATLIGDEAKLRQILTNLIGNALKFTDHGEVVIRVMVEDIIENCAILKISVTDTGIGIEEKDQQRLFFTFEQVDSSSTRKFSGTGLGLSISKTLTELMGGKLEVESKPNIGSTFAFTFKHNIPAPQKIELNHETDAKLRIIRGVRVLVYDSNQVSQMAINHLLNNIELTTILVNNRDKLLSTAKELQENDQTLYILLSLSQHDVSSNTLKSQINTLAVNNKTKLVGVINSADPEVLLRIKNYGFDVCLSKPLHYQDIVDTFHSLVVDKLELAPVIATEAVTSDVSPISHAALAGMKILVAEDNEINAKLVDALLSQA
ncbi:MAG: ATP-binding protein, partial [Thiohalomonadales bacterium]